MRIVFISDTHTLTPPIEPIPDGNIIICAGDISNRGSKWDIQAFAHWFSGLPHRHKITIAGNHDLSFENNHQDAVKWLTSNNKIIYLQDHAVTIDDIKIYGSPWQPAFCNWGFNLPRNTGELAEKWKMIPSDTDIVVTHGPPHKILDKCENGYNAGCEELRQALLSRIKPLVHAFGHIHEGHGVLEFNDIHFLNASICDARYAPINKPIVVDICNGKVHDVIY